MNRKIVKGYEWKVHKRGTLSDNYVYENMLNFTIVTKEIQIPLKSHEMEKYLKI